MDNKEEIKHQHQLEQIQQLNSNIQSITIQPNNQVSSVLQNPFQINQSYKPAQPIYSTLQYNPADVPINQTYSQQIYYPVQQNYIPVQYIYQANQFSQVNVPIMENYSSNSYVNSQYQEDYMPVEQVYQTSYTNYNQVSYLPAAKVGLTLLNDKQENKDKKVVAIIISFCNSCSYDELFTTVEQKSIEGTKVEVYSCDSIYIDNLNEAFDGNPKEDIDKRLIQTIKTIDSDCVVFNWECCGGYSGGNIPEGQDKLFKFLKKMIDRGHMCMFSDFSLMALIKGWDQKYELGPNPFVKTSQTSSEFEIRFNNGILKECPSAQLQVVGDMAENGRCLMHALGGTIVYAVDKNKLNHNIYQLQTLTIVPKHKPHDENLVSKIGEFQGSAGHILLRYPNNKGMILTSMGHWIQLMKIDTSEEKLFEVAQKQYGAAYASNMRQQYMQMDEVSKVNYIQSNAQEFVRNQAPCKQMYKK